MIIPPSGGPSESLSIPFGAFDSRTFFWTNRIAAPDLALVTVAMVTSTPQVLLSLLYFAYNGLFTQFLFAREWDSFQSERKGLRVSSDHLEL